jgi:hypothetical protein
VRLRLPGRIKRRRRLRFLEKGPFTAAHPLVLLPKTEQACFELFGRTRCDIHRHWEVSDEVGCRNLHQDV